MTKLILLLLAAVLCLLCGCHPEGTRGNDEAAIRAVLAAASSHLKSRELEAWAALYADDAVLQSPGEPEVRSRAALLNWARSLPQLEAVQFSNVAIDVHGDLAYATTDYVTQPKGMPPHSGKQLLVFRRTDGGDWKVVAASMSANVPLPEPPAGVESHGDTSPPNNSFKPKPLRGSA